jgi:hypothetical protein
MQTMWYCGLQWMTRASSMLTVMSYSCRLNSKLRASVGGNAGSHDVRPCWGREETQAPWCIPCMNFKR